MIFHESSFRDRSGGIFSDQGKLYRWIAPAYLPHYRHLMESGLYKQLTEQGLLIPHEEREQQWPALPAGSLIIEPEYISFISYPYEWSFSQYKAAALLTLEIQTIAFAHGMTLKDATAFNVQFYQGRPVLIDTLSFEQITPGQPWIAYRQFCQHFLAPLALMSACDPRLGDLMRIYLDGIPLEMATALLPWRSRFRSGLGLHLFLHARTARNTKSSQKNQSAVFSASSFQGLIQSLQRSVQHCALRQTPTTWGDYYESGILHQAYLQAKLETVRAWLAERKPAYTWDLGANDGTFSRLAAQYGHTIAFDFDPVAVDQNYLRTQEEGLTNLLPLRLDLSNPSPALGWVNEERTAWLNRPLPELTLALALVHHLAIGNQVPLDRLAAFFAKISPWLLIEFVPKGDPRVEEMLFHREAAFSDYSQPAFEAAFLEYFDLIQSKTLPETTRTLYLMYRKS